MNHAHESGVDPTGFPGRLVRRRRVLGLTQEELADRLDVTRQAVQKWESGASQPGMEKLSALAETLDMSLDALVLGREAPPPPPEREGAPAGDPWENRETATQTAPPCPGRHAAFCRCWHYEYKSRRTLWGLPLVHIHLMSRGLCRAKGVLAIGNVATGLVALGGFSFGLVSLGAISLGLLFSLGGLSLGLFSLGAVAAGVLAAGAVALGWLALGASAAGQYAVGAAALGGKIAVGVSARADLLAIGRDSAQALHTLTPELFSQAAQFMQEERLPEVLEALVPSLPWLRDFLLRAALSVLGA